MYNMALDKDHLYDYEFFKRVDNHMNLKLIDLKELDGKFAFAALYGYYSFGVGKPENVMIFERLLAENPALLSKYLNTCDFIYYHLQFYSLIYILLIYL